MIFPDDKIYTYNNDVRKLLSEKDQERMFFLFSALQSKSGVWRPEGDSFFRSFVQINISLHFWKEMSQSHGHPVNTR